MGNRKEALKNLKTARTLVDEGFYDTANTRHIALFEAVVILNIEIEKLEQPWWKRVFNRSPISISWSKMR